jgi:hypothetical protein
MSIGTEERLELALRARADALSVDDLRPLEVPEPAPPSRKAWLLVLAVAALVAVAALPFLTESSDDRPPVPVPEGAVRMDLNGDGDDDVVSVDFDPAAHTYQVRAQMFEGETLVHQGLALNRPTLIGAVDLDGDFSEEIAVNVGDDTGTLPEFIRHLEGRLVRLAPPAAGTVVNGWQMGSARSQFTIQSGRLYTWLEAREGRLEQRVPFWQWRVVGEARIEPGQRQQRCLPDGETVPVDCVFVPQSVTVEQRPDLDGDDLPDNVSLSYTARPTDDLVSRYAVDYALAAGAGGQVVGGGGWRPELLPPVSLGGDASQQVLVRQQGGESDALTVLGLVDGALRVLAAPEDPPLATDVDLRGRISGYVLDGDRLLSYRSLPTQDYTRPLTVDVWSWTVAGGELLADPQGQQCLVEGSELPEPC